MDNPNTVVKQLFGEALELPREQRAAFLDKACNGRNELRRQVEAILAENDRLNGVLSDSPWNLKEVFPEEPARGPKYWPRNSPWAISHDRTNGRRRHGRRISRAG